MGFDIRDTAKEHVIIAAHRGISGGNIPCNTITAYEIALLQGADMIEIDLNMSADGVLIIFHPQLEPYHLGKSISLTDMSYQEIRKLRYQNFDRVETQFGIPSFDNVLEHFKGRCYINVDKFWDHPKEIYQAVKRHNMLDQVVAKCHLSEDALRFLEDIAPDLPFMPIVKNTYPYHDMLLARKINYIGAEFVFDTEDAEVASCKTVEQMHRDGKLIWANAIIYNHRRQLAAGHSDDTALSESMDKGWGWLADRGFDIIQTDWAMMLINYLKKSNKYYR